MSDPTARPTLPTESPAPWLLGPADLDALRADDALISRLAFGEKPDPADPVAVHLPAWLAEVAR